MNIRYDDIHTFKRYDLSEIIRSYGIELKKSREGYLARCPFHDDKNPSLSINKKGEVWLWHCFGCREGGTVIDFVMKKEGIPFKEVYERLKEITGQTHQKSPKNAPERLDLLKNVLDFYHKTFLEDKNALGYLLKRGIKMRQTYEAFKIGYSDGSLPKQKEITPVLKELGILNEKGNESFYKCVVFPIEDTQGNILGLYGRRTVSKDQMYLKGAHKGVFNARVFKVSKKIYLAECVIDALSLYQVGVREVASLFGAGGLTPDHLKYMRENLTEEVILCLDSDEAGRKATQKISQTLSRELSIKCFKLNLPEGVKDLNEWLLKGMTKEDVINSVKEIPRPVSSPALDTGIAPKTTSEGDIHFDFTSTLPNRTYRIRGLDLKRVGSFKTSIKIKADSGSHLDTFDLASSILREKFIKMTGKLLGLTEGVIRQDLSKIIDSLEEIQSKYLADKAKEKKPDPRTVTDGEREEALALLKFPDLLKRIVRDFHACGYMGEDANLLMGYLAATSRKLSSPLSLLVISRSSAGKTSLQDAVLSFIPHEDVVKYTRLTDQSLFYHEEDSLYKKVLAIEEEMGASGAAYAIRNVLTSKFLKTGSTIKDPESGLLKVQSAKVKIQTSVFLTTTERSLSSETLNRFIIATIDESEEQTRRILEYQRRLYGEEGHSLRKKRKDLMRLHNNAQRLLEELEVVNPYQGELTFTTKTLRARREHMKYLTLINAVALLRQHQKEVKRRDDSGRYIQVDFKDIEEANRLARVYLTKNLDHLSPPARALYNELRALARKVCAERGINQDEVILSRRQIMEYTGWSEWQVRTHTRELVNLEYLTLLEGSRGRRYAYRLLEDFDYEIPLADIGVISPEKLAEKAEIRENSQNFVTM